jgi:hypothetical protein
MNPHPFVVLNHFTKPFAILPSFKSFSDRIKVSQLAPDMLAKQTNPGVCFGLVPHGPGLLRQLPTKI